MKKLDCLNKGSLLLSHLDFEEGESAELSRADSREPSIDFTSWIFRNCKHYWSDHQSHSRCSLRECKYYHTCYQLFELQHDQKLLFNYEICHLRELLSFINPTVHSFSFLQELSLTDFNCLIIFVSSFFHIKFPAIIHRLCLLIFRNLWFYIHPLNFLNSPFEHCSIKS